MAGGLYGRVAARGFPSVVAAGLTGQGSLESQGGPQDPVHGQASTVDRPSTIAGYEADQVAPYDGILIAEGAFGLSGTVNPDQIPHTHAAPVPGWAGSYDDPDLLTVNLNSMEIHSADFGASPGRRHVSAAEGQEPAYDQWSNLNTGENVLQTLDGQIRMMGGYDTTQGYDLRNRYGFDAGHVTGPTTATEPQPMFFLGPAERPFVVPQASGDFTPTDDYQGPGGWASGWDAAAVNSTPPTAYQPSPEPDTLDTPLVGAPVSAGWWG